MKRVKWSELPDGLSGAKELLNSLIEGWVTEVVKDFERSRNYGDKFSMNQQVSTLTWPLERPYEPISRQIEVEMWFEFLRVEGFLTLESFSTQGKAIDQRFAKPSVKLLKVIRQICKDNIPLLKPQGCYLDQDKQLIGSLLKLILTHTVVVDVDLKPDKFIDEYRRRVRNAFCRNRPNLSKPS